MRELYDGSIAVHFIEKLEFVRIFFNFSQDDKNFSVPIQSIVDYWRGVWHCFLGIAPCQSHILAKADVGKKTGVEFLENVDLQENAKTIMDRTQKLWRSTTNVEHPDITAKCHQEQETHSLWTYYKEERYKASSAKMKINRRRGKRSPRTNWKHNIDWTQMSYNLSPPQLLTIYKISDSTFLEHCSHIWGGAANSSLRLLDKVQSKAISLTNNPNITNSLLSR